MGLYGLGIKPLISDLDEVITPEECIQAWYADDSSSAGELNQMKTWWDTLCLKGPKYGYYPLASKTILIVKDDQLEKAQEIFGHTGVKITTEGERHMGAAIGSENPFAMWFSVNNHTPPAGNGWMNTRPLRFQLLNTFFNRSVTGYKHWSKL
jgi:hypothetical protein